MDNRQKFVPNEEFRQRAQIQLIQERIKEQTWKYIDYILRPEGWNYAREALNWITQSVMKRGSPKITWRRAIEM